MIKDMSDSRLGFDKVVEDFLATNAKLRHKSNQFRVESGILVSLIFGSKSFYDFTRKEKIGSNTLVLNALSKLKQRKLIKEGPPEKRKKIPYSLTLPGVFHAIFCSPPNYWGKIADEWSEHIPLVLGKWSFFEEMGMKELAQYRMNRTITEFKIFFNYDPDQFASEDEFKSSFTQTFHTPWIFWTSKQRVAMFHDYSFKWIEMCMADVELKKYIHELLKLLIDDFKDFIERRKIELEYYVNMRNFFNMISDTISSGDVKKLKKIEENLDEYLKER